MKFMAIILMMSFFLGNNVYTQEMCAQTLNKQYETKSQQALEKSKTELSLASINVDESYWDEKIVKTYVHNSEMQRRWALSFLSSHLRSLEGNESILDIGCGDGRITADISRFIPQGMICGVDPAEAMLNWARKQYHPMDYPNLSFRNGGFINVGTGGHFDLVISCCAFQQCPDPKQGLNNAAKLIKTGGKLLFILPAGHNPAWNQAVKEIQMSSQWSCYWKNSPQYRRLSIDDYRQILQDNGFTDIQIDHYDTMDPFIDRDELINMWLGVYPSIIPRNLERQFFIEIIDQYFKLYPEGISSDGVILLKCGYLGISAKKL